jgi:hypothetical protein
LKSSAELPKIDQAILKGLHQGIKVSYQGIALAMP